MKPGSVNKFEHVEFNRDGNIFCFRLFGLNIKRVFLRQKHGV